MFKKHLNIFLILILVGFNFHINLFAQEGCTKQIETAKKYFYEGNFESAIEILETCLTKKQLNKLQKGEIYLNLAIVYFAKQDTLKSKDYLRSLFKINPNYKITRNQVPPDFYKFALKVQKKVQTFSQKIPKFKKKKSLFSPLMLIGGGIVIVGTTIYLLLPKSRQKKKTTEEILPLPPDWPE